jgi:hypothetical protein
MTLTIELAPATLERLKAEAAATGKDVQTLIGEAVEARFARRRQSLAEILKPIHDEREASGISEEELEFLVDDAARETRLERRGSRSGQ